MQFLKTLFWVALAVILVLFSIANWTPVTLNLWGGLQADVKLPVLVLSAFLLGFVPMMILHRARLWSLKRRIDLQGRQTAIVTVPQPSVSGHEHVRPAAAPAP
jgi:lipopolysaccharide assembly protein A